MNHNVNVLEVGIWTLARKMASFNFSEKVFVLQC